MSFFSHAMSSAGRFFDGLLGVDNSDVEATRQAVSDYLGSDAIAKASQPLNSEEGQRLTQALGTLQPVAYKEPNAAANDAAVDALKKHYEAQFRDGGFESRAAVQQAQLAGDLTSRGTVGGIHQDILDSVGRQQRVAAVAGAEHTAGGNAANALQASDANAALKRAVLAAQVSHANFENAYNQNAAAFGLRNTQGQLTNYAQGAQSDATYQQAQIDLEQRAQEAAIGKAMLTALTSGLSGGIGTAMSQASAASAPSTITAGHLPTAPTSSNMLGSYMMPAAQVGADAVARTYTPIFNTPSAAPIDPGYWGGK